MGYRVDGDGVVGAATGTNARTGNAPTVAGKRSTDSRCDAFPGGCCRSPRASASCTRRSAIRSRRAGRRAAAARRSSAVYLFCGRASRVWPRPLRRKEARTCAAVRRSRLLGAVAQKGCRWGRGHGARNRLTIDPAAGRNSCRGMTRSRRPGALSAGVPEPGTRLTVQASLGWSTYRLSNTMAPNGQQTEVQRGSGSGGQVAWMRQNPCKLAEGVGFEPTNDLRRCRFSRPVR